MNHRQAIAAVVALLLAVTAYAQKTAITVTTTVPEGSLLFTAMTQPFVSAVHSRCGDAVDLKPFGTGVLAPFNEGHKAVQDGRATAAHTTPIWAVNLDPTNAILGSLPGGLSPEAMLVWLYKEGGRDLWVKYRREQMGLHPIVVGMGTTEIFAHSHKPIRNGADLKGMKFRTAGAWAEIIKTFGATPVVLAGADVYPMLERRAIDAAEFLNPSGNSTSGLANIAKFVIVPGIHSASWPYEVVFKADFFDKLPKPVQACLTDAGELATLQAYTTFGALDLKAMATMREKNEIISLNPAFVQEVKALGRKWMLEKAEEQAGKGNKWVKEITGSYFRFQDSWERNSDYRAR
ncbi:MAG: C4-dicarboxylate ABC transporter substrate-binding protein [Betaproteobacteria bacterium]|nr:C4-dicarboxylate ABC transporter substrate-binding protein [Betaproteobacteria bacterium]